MHLREALNQIAEIRLRMAESELFRGYRSLPIALSGLYAIGAAILQPLLIPDPTSHPSSYVLFWGVIALASMVTAGTTMLLRDCLAGSSGTRAVTWMALRQLIPSLVAGGGITWVILQRAVDAAWMLPGLWAVLFSQGIFASARLLPKPIFWIGFYYLVLGLFTLTWANEANSFSPWAMALNFGVGQLLTALVLYLTLERNHVEVTEVE